nr:MAG TPA: hypothetical protein [Caudoviricetes sp.]
MIRFVAAGGGHGREARSGGRWEILPPDFRLTGEGVLVFPSLRETCFWESLR